MDLALNNLQRLICHKTQQTNQPLERNVVWTLQRHLFGRYVDMLEFLKTLCLDVTKICYMDVAMTCMDVTKIFCMDVKKDMYECFNDILYGR